MERIERFIEKHPRLYHMAERGSWPSIQTYGLLSTLALLDLFGVGGVKRHTLFSHWRRDSIPIKHSEHGTAIIRDQHPMPPENLSKVLAKGVTPSQWYELLNSRCFLWPTEERLKRMLKARPYKDNKHIVITLDARELLARDMARITVSHINSGNARRSKTIRGCGTFHSIKDCCIVGRKNGIAELSVDYQVPNIKEVSLSVAVRQGDDVVKTIWER